MNVETKELENREVQLTVEVEPERVKKAKHAAARRLSRQVSIPGFRKGKAPYPVVARYLGESAVMEEVLENLGPRLYEEALESTELDAGGPGELVDAELDPLKLIFRVPLQPEVDLGDYRDLRLDYEAVEVEDAAVNETLQRLREHHALLEPVERPAEMGDVVTLDVLGLIGEGDDADELMDDKNVELLLGDEHEWPLPGFDEHIVGIAAEETRTFDQAFPEDYSNASLAGQVVHFTITCQGIKSHTLPELDDDFAALVSDEYETLLDLRVAIRENLQREAEAKRDEAYREQAVESITSQATVGYAPSVLRRQVDEMVEERKRIVRNRGLQFEDYLKLDNKTEEEFRAELEPDAEEQLKRGLVLGKVIEMEGIEVTDEALDARIDETASAFGDAADDIRKAFQSESGRRSVRMDLLVDQAIERLVAIAKGEAPELPSADETEDQSDYTERM